MLFRDLIAAVKESLRYGMLILLIGEFGNQSFTSLVNNDIKNSEIAKRDIAIQS
jgi:hypothetical protein